MNSEEFVRRLRKGGSIVSSGECTPYEISLARCCNRFYVDEDGFGYVYRPQPQPQAKTSSEIEPWAGCGE